MSAVETLLAKQAITEAIYRYCRAMDRIDNELGFTVFHPEATANYVGVFDGGAHEFVEWVNARHATYLAQFHSVSNILIEVDGDSAGSEAYISYAIRIDDKGVLKERVGRGRYLDKWSRRDGVWRIAKRVYVGDFGELRTVTGEEAAAGKRDRSDPSYQFLTRQLAGG